MQFQDSVSISSESESWATHLCVNMKFLYTDSGGEGEEASATKSEPQFYITRSAHRRFMAARNSDFVSSLTSSDENYP